MRREDKRRTQGLLEQRARKVGVPGVAVDHVGLFQQAHHGHVPEQGVHKGTVSWIPGFREREMIDTCYFPLRGDLLLISEAEQSYRVFSPPDSPERAGKILDMNPGLRTLRISVRTCLRSSILRSPNAMLAA